MNVSAAGCTGITSSWVLDQISTSLSIFQYRIFVESRPRPPLPNQWARIAVVESAGQGFRYRLGSPLVRALLPPAVLTTPPPARFCSTPDHHCEPLKFQSSKLLVLFKAA